ncbi:unnamed protein product [Fraxinus pennsylvanica]|uniref:Reverse transcriptase domain-containing protein n=1 Tax=Fraxinus pennsylvanica TaxID=56036 RepID=A0AAD2A1H8_9LAMI|nr:unnamed protein product [Fraxinus pennsylvanica]
MVSKAPDIEEIKEAVYIINKDSAASPDGFSSLFYQYSWDIIKLDLLDAILDFFNGREIPTGITLTSIALIPKKAEAKEYKEFRPIRRNIGDNILLAQELIQNIDRKTRGGNMVLKLDMAKAYGNSFIRGLNNLFSSNVDLHFRYGGGIPISHLAFADDIVIFTNGQKTSLNKIMRFISLYTVNSGQAINCNKSSFTTRKEAHRKVIADNTGFQYQSLPMIYLGVPLYKGHKKAALFDDLISKIKRRILGWEHRWFSASGRITLIKHVLSSMPIHLLQILDPLIGIINKISRMFNNFIWGDSSQTKKIRWASWENICCPVEEGGIGCQSLSDLNIAFDCKLWWKFREQKSLWSQVLLAKCCRTSHASVVNHSYQDSGIWRRMVKARKLTEPHIAWRIGEGKINFKHDVWLKSGIVQGRLKQDMPQDKLVLDFRNNNEWNTISLNSILPA